MVCFIGHRVIERTKELEFLLKETILALLKKGVTTFLFGSMSEFNCLSWEVVTELKKEYPYIKRVYVRSAYQYLDKAYETYLLQFYEETYFPQRLEKAGRCVYVERNYEMIDRSSYCVFYYNENYVALSKRPALFSSKRNSGTKLAYTYAIKKKKQSINLYK